MKPPTKPPALKPWPVREVPPEAVTAFLAVDYPHVTDLSAADIAYYRRLASRALAAAAPHIVAAARRR